MERVEQQQSDERAEKSAGVVARPFEPEGAAAVRFLRPKRRSAHRAAPSAQPAPSRSRSRAPNTTCQTVASPISGLRWRRGNIREGDGFPPLQPVGQGAGQTLDDVLRRLGKAVDQADDAAGRRRASASGTPAAPDRASRSRCRRTGWRRRGETSSVKARQSISARWQSWRFIRSGQKRHAISARSARGRAPRRCGSRPGRAPRSCPRLRRGRTPG